MWQIDGLQVFRAHHKVVDHNPTLSPRIHVSGELPLTEHLGVIRIDKPPGDEYDRYQHPSTLDVPYLVL